MMRYPISQKPSHLSSCSHHVDQRYLPDREALRRELERSLREAER